MALITLAVLFASFVLILVAMQEKTKLEREFGRPTTCPVVVTKDDVVQDELAKISGLTPYKALVECYCENILLSQYVWLGPGAWSMRTLTFFLVTVARLPP